MTSFQMKPVLLNDNSKHSHVYLVLPTFSQILLKTILSKSFQSILLEFQKHIFSKTLLLAVFNGGHICHHS